MVGEEDWRTRVGAEIRVPSGGHRSSQVAMSRRVSFVIIFLAAVGGAGDPRAALAQSLRGSGASVERMYRYAVQDGLTFYETGASVNRAVSRGDLVALRGTHEFELHRVNFPYVRPATRTFVERLADQYERVCGEPLVVTSGVRPESRQPRNSSDLSVHPTGMAVDLRRPEGTCLSWLRRTLLDLEADGVIEATEEHRPAHFHVAVFAEEYVRYVERTTRPSTLAARAPEDDARYRVRPGDSLWSIAQQHETTVRDVVAANKLGDTTIQPGQTLVIPGTR